jgi:ribosomal protein L25 (general stress protein Ctc)
VYSSFWEQGGQLFSEFLQEKGVTYEYITPETKSAVPSITKRFLSGETAVIILHPDMTEGVTIQGAKQMHVLEPVLSFAKQQQLVARVQRYQSHAMLPLEERHVDIFFWYASINGPLQWMRSTSQSMRQWSFKNINMNFLNRSLDFAQDMTPDFMVKQDLERLQAVVALFKSRPNTTANAILKSKANSQLEPCCLWTPLAKNVDRCLSRDMCALNPRGASNSRRLQRRTNDMNSAYGYDTGNNNANTARNDNAFHNASQNSFNTDLGTVDGRQNGALNRRGASNSRRLQRRTNDMNSAYGYETGNNNTNTASNDNAFHNASQNSFNTDLGTVDGRQNGGKKPSKRKMKHTICLV